MASKRKPLSAEHRQKISAGLKGRVVSDETRAKIGLANTGKIRTPEMLHRLSTAHVGIPSPKKGLPMSDEQKVRMSEAMTAYFAENPHPMTGKQNPKLAKERNPNWQGGKTAESQVIRTSFRMKVWRKAVFERDNYTCQFCGQRGGDIQADHIKPFAGYPELRFELSNGRTLCVPCHRSTPTYGLGAIRESA